MADDPLVSAAIDLVPVVGGGRLIMLVDDEDPLRRSVRRALERMGYAVIEASDGAAAVALFRQRHHDLAAVVLDHVMPVMSGKEALVAMRVIDPAVPVILTSGGIDGSEADELAELGVRAVLAKPFDIEQLSRALAGIAAGSG